MPSDTKTVITLTIAVVAIVIALIAISMSILTTQANNQNTLQQNNKQQHYTGEKREFWLFTTEMPDFNQTRMAMPSDIFSPSTIAVNKGDTVVIHFFNTEEFGGDPHTFTIYNPYNINVVLRPGENQTITFDADTTGIFIYYCTFHQPTMRGQLIVQPPPY